MNNYRLDFIDNDVKTTEVNQTIESEGEMSFTLPNNTHVFLTHNFIHEMKERIEDLNSDYEDERISSIRRVIDWSNAPFSFN
jgi:hypothetical protein